MARVGFWIALPMPALSVLQNWYQGILLNKKQTRSVPESVVVFFAAVLVVLVAGVTWGSLPGLFVGMAGFVLANIAQMAWLWYRSRTARKELASESAGWVQPLNLQ
jgi:hypothetical protein